jgi:hypothetical protein
VLVDGVARDEPAHSARAQWLQDTGRMTLGQRRERLVVIRADR